MLVYSTDPPNSDGYGDGCKDGKEIGSDESKGGRRVDDILNIVHQRVIVAADPLTK